MSIPDNFLVFKGTPSGKLVGTYVPRKKPEGAQVLVEIHNSGFCYTDLHFRQQDMVLGHEGVGVVKELGPMTRYLKIGDRVGFGWCHASCGKCEECISGNGCHCRVDRHEFGKHELDQGGFASHAIWQEDFLYPIPDGMSFEDAAPMMCAGITVFAPMARHGLQPTDRVGVVGIGALGHLAIQFAAKMGCEVVAFSGSESKREEAMEFGASEFVVTPRGSAQKITMKGKPLNHLFVTTSALPKSEGWQPFIDLMASFGTIYPVTVDLGDISFPALPALLKSLAFRPCAHGSRLMMLQMLKFAVRHDIKAKIERLPLNEDGLVAAQERLLKGGVKYKVVMEVKV